MSSCKDSTHIRHNQITLINKSSPGRRRGRGRGKEGQGEGGFAALKSCHAKDVHGKKLIKVFAHNNNNNNIRLNEIFISQWTEGRSQGTGRDGEEGSRCLGWSMTMTSLMLQVPVRFSVGSLCVCRKCLLLKCLSLSSLTF